MGNGGKRNARGEGVDVCICIHASMFGAGIMCSRAPAEMHLQAGSHLDDLEARTIGHAL